LQFPYSANTNQFKNRKRKKLQYQSPTLTQGGPLTHDKKNPPLPVRNCATWLGGSASSGCKQRLAAKPQRPHPQGYLA